MLTNFSLRVLSYLFLEQNTGSLQQPPSAAIFPGTIFRGTIFLGTIIFLGTPSWGRPVLSPLHPCCPRPLHPCSVAGGDMKSPLKEVGGTGVAKPCPHQVLGLIPRPWSQNARGGSTGVLETQHFRAGQRHQGWRVQPQRLPDRSLPGRIACLLPSVISFQFAGTRPASSQPPSPSLLSEDAYRGWNPALPHHPSQKWLTTSLCR